MGKPDTIIYSDAIYASLLREFGAEGSQVPAGAKAKVGGINLAWVEEAVELSLLVPEAGIAISEQETVWKVRAGSLADVAPVAFAHGSDMATYKTIVFDLDFELGERALHRIVELNLGVTGDGRYRTPVTWSTLAAQDRLILLVLPRLVQLAGSPAQKRLSPAIGNPPSTNYDLIHGLPFKFSPYATPEGRVLAPDNYLPDADLDKKAGEALKPWIEHGIAFRSPDPNAVSVETRKSSFYALRLGDRLPTIAGIFRYEKSFVGYLPPADLAPASWLKTMSRIGEALNEWRQSTKKISKMADASDLENVKLIVRPVAESGEWNTVEVWVEANDKECRLEVREREGRNASNFSEAHQKLIAISKEHGPMTIKEMAEELDKDVGKVRWLMTTLRKAAGPALEKIGFSAALGDKMFPLRLAGVSSNMRRQNIIISGSPHP